MDVTPPAGRALCAALLALFCFTACGNRFDLSTERGRQARLDEANFLLSKGSCSAALDAVLPLYQSPDVNDEVRLVTASAYACQGTFNLLTLAGNLTGSSNFFQTLAKSLGNRPNDGARSAMFQATDVLTRGGTLSSASQRSRAVNSYMVFLQLGLIGTEMRNYGSPALDGSQGDDLLYSTQSNPAGEMSNVDACAVAAGVAMMVDSYAYSDLNDANTKSVSDTLNSLCQSAGLSSCAALNLSRTACDGTNSDSQAAAAVIAGVNAGW